jgi:hypothetical protein
MTCVFSRGNDCIVVANRRFRSLMAFGLEVGEALAVTDSEKEMVRDLLEKEKEFYGGYNFDLLLEFPSVEQNKFWVKVYYEVARRVFLRTIGNQDVDYWQSSLIGDCWFLIRMMMESVHDKEPDWLPEKFT